MNIGQTVVVTLDMPNMGEVECEGVLKDISEISLVLETKKEEITIAKEEILAVHAI